MLISQVLIYVSGGHLSGLDGLDNGCRPAGAVAAGKNAGHVRHGGAGARHKRSPFDGDDTFCKMA